MSNSSPVRRHPRQRNPARILAALMAAVILLLAGSAGAGVQSPVNSQMIRRSEEFVVYDTRRFGRSLAAFADIKNPELVQLEPDTLLLSAERINETMTRQLGVPVRGGGKIHCYLYAPLRNNDNIILVSTLYADGWQYRLQIPDDLERMKLVRGIVQALLLELANRGTSQKSAEIPTWLLEGLTKQVLTEVGPGLVLDSVPTNHVRPSLWEIRGADSLAEARAYFRTRPPLSFTELSNPVISALSGEQLHLYQLSSQLLLSELRLSNGGRARLISMLHGLPNCWNWQTAFLSAFQFPRLLDVEKWWALSATAFMGRETVQLASTEACLARLGEILIVPTQVRLNTNAVPVRTEATMIRVIAEWQYTQQRPVLQQKLLRLALLRATAPKQLVPLIESYWACLHDYMTRRDQSGYASENKRQVNVPGHLLAHEAVRQLSLLDQQRAAQRQQLTSSAGATERPQP